MLFCVRKGCRCALRPRWRGILSLSAMALAALLVWPVRAQQQASPEPELPPALVRQVETLMAEKAQRTPAQRKVSSHLLHAARIEQGEPIVGDVVPALSAVEIGPDGTVTVDIRADVAPEVLARIDALDGSVINSVPQYGAVRARLPLAAVESLAELDAVQSIRPADEAVTRGQSIAIRAAARTAPADPVVVRKVNTSEGDVAHRADQARRRYGVDGTGIGIGVLSDGVDTLADRQASGDLPTTVTVLPGQARPSEADDTVTFDEGTAMLEIVHDLAPGADLYFATAFNGQAQFAANIEALCAAGADVIVDDIGYLREAPFQDDIVAQGINAAVAAGCIYFSAAGNNGNLNAGTSGVWEGDFNEGTPFTIDGNVVGTSHRFNSRGANVNRITVYDFALMCLKWSDPLGASANDYDLYLVDPDENTIHTSVSSTDTQNGSQDPVECIPVVEFRATGEVVDLTRYRLLVVKAAGRGRYLHLNTHGGRLTFATDGQMYDHAAAVNAIGGRSHQRGRSGRRRRRLRRAGVGRMVQLGRTPPHLLPSRRPGDYAGQLLVHRRPATAEAGRDRGRRRVDGDARVRDVPRHVGGSAARRGHRRADAAGGRRPPLADARAAPAGDAGHGARHRGTGGLGSRLRRRYRRRACRHRRGSEPVHRPDSRQRGQSRSPHRAAHQHRCGAAPVRTRQRLLDRSRHRLWCNPHQGGAHHTASHRPRRRVSGVRTDAAGMD